ncbi:MAG: hypothetical protein ACI4U5_06735 [Bacilli bacterium]
MKKKLLMNKFEIIGYLGYFIILLIERTLALIFSINKGEEYSLLSGNVFPIISYSFTALSILLSVIFLPKILFIFFIYLFSKEELDFVPHYKYITLTSIVILLGGMMHTGYTLSPLQFVSYGFLIISFLIRTIKQIQHGDSKFECIISLVYLVFFSMTIPVCYITYLDGIQMVLFYVAEFITTLSLLFIFGKMMYCFLDKGKSIFNVAYFIIMLVLCSLTIGLKWIDEINVFVIIFVVLSSITYIINTIYSLFIIKKNK